jgi:DNA-binding response OmpR family regulator
MSSLPVVLILEDETLIAMKLEDDFEAAGYTVSGAFATCRSALDWLGSDTPDVAVLDTTVRDGTCKDLAVELNRRGIPFVVYSGHPEDRNVIEELNDAVWIEKPASTDILITAIETILNQATRQQT